MRGGCKKSGKSGPRVVVVSNFWRVVSVVTGGYTVSITSEKTEQDWIESRRDLYGVGKKEPEEVKQSRGRENQRRVEGPVRKSLVKQ